MGSDHRHRHVSCRCGVRVDVDVSRSTDHGGGGWHRVMVCDGDVARGRDDGASERGGGVNIIWREARKVGGKSKDRTQQTSTSGYLCLSAVRPPTSSLNLHLF